MAIVVRPLRCTECGREDDFRLGWRLYLDSEDELVAFCPECAQREFQDA